MIKPHNGARLSYHVLCSRGCGKKIPVSKRDAKFGVKATCGGCATQARVDAKLAAENLAAMDARAREADRKTSAAIADFQNAQLATEAKP